MPPPTTFAVWGDSPLANEELAGRLRTAGHSAQVVHSGQLTDARYLVALRRRPLSPAEAVERIRLANASRADLLVTTPEAESDPLTRLRLGYRLAWDGDLRDLERVASWIAAAHASLDAAPREAIPRIFTPPDDLLVGLRCETEAELLRTLRTGTTRLVPVRAGLVEELRHRLPARSRQDYDLKTVLDWAVHHQHRALAHPQLRLLGWGTRSYVPSGQSLHDITQDPRTTSLITLIGEPGTGKTVQLRHLNAQSALAALRAPDGGRVLETFYVPLFDHPPDADISFDWVAEAWNGVVSPGEWCTFDEFLRGGGSVILDGYSEVGAHPHSLSEWMLKWRSVVTRCFERGARRVVVSCRTRDQLIPLPSARGEEPTAVALAPLAPEEVVLLASGHDLAAGRTIARAIDRDAELASFYASPFRLQTYLDSGASTVARTDARLFGAAIVAAILRERDQLNFHHLLLPEREVAALVTVQGQTEEDPWPLLVDVPLIRILAALARSMTLSDDGRPPGPADRQQARAAVAEGLAAEGLTQMSPADVLGTAIDLHILIEDGTHHLRFSHRIVRQLLAAMTVEVDRVITLVHATQPEVYTAPAGAGRTRAAAYAENEGVGLALAAAQMHGERFTEALAAVNPALAADAHVTARLDTGSRSAERICAALHKMLEAAASPAAATSALEALSRMGWKRPQPRPGELDPATHRIPAREWLLGRHIDTGDATVDRVRREVTSERRTIELDAFRIADGPVTNGEFDEFVADGGYDRQDLWTTAGWDWRTRREAVEQFVANWIRKRDTLRRNPRRIVRLVQDGLATPAQAAALVRFIDLDERDLAAHARTRSNQPIREPEFWQQIPSTGWLNPVVGVSWFEANAFCAWKAEQLGALVRLPTEDEWEAACVWRLERGGPGAVNSVESGAGGTSPVGAYEPPSSEAPKDMMGNCFEWTFDYYRAGDHFRRIVKGGSWRQERWRAHPAYRGRMNISIRVDDVGFRYVVEEPRA